MVKISKQSGNYTHPKRCWGIRKKTCVSTLSGLVLICCLAADVQYRDALLNERHGLRGDRLTTVNRIECLWIRLSALSQTKLTLLAVFIDFKPAFASDLKAIVLTKFTQLGLQTKLLRKYFGKNLITFNSGVVKRNSVEQTTGFIQLDSLRLSLFSLVIRNVRSQIR